MSTTTTTSTIGEHGAVFVFVFVSMFVSQNIWHLTSRATAEGADEQVTTSGIDGQVYNGIPDWVSEEEVFEDNKALWWSPDGSKLVYGVFNDTLVDTVNLPRYGHWHNKLTNRQGYPFLQYFIMDQFRYPKSGTT